MEKSFNIGTTVKSVIKYFKQLLHRNHFESVKKEVLCDQLYFSDFYIMGIDIKTMKNINMETLFHLRISNFRGILTSPIIRKIRE